MNAEPLSGGGTTLGLRTDADRELGLVARLCEGGPVLDAVQAVPVAADNGSYYRILQTYPDGSQLAEVSLLLGAVPPGLSVELVIFVAGVSFEDGTRRMVLTADDFDAMGICRIRFVKARGVTSSVCHRTYIRQNGLLVWSNEED